MKKAIIAIFLFSMFATLCLAQTSPAEARAYKIGMIHWIAYSPLNVADTKGFWKELGVDVQVVNYTANQDLNNALRHKKIDIALDMIGSWIGMYQDGEPLKIICETDWSNGGDKIIVKKDLDLSKIKNDTIGVYLNMPSVTFFLNKYLAKNGSKLSDWKLIELETEPLANFFNGDRIRISVNYDPQALRQEREGNGKTVATSADFAGCIPEGMTAREDVLKEIPKDDLVKIMKGFRKAVEWAGDPKNQAEFFKILNEKTFEGEKPYSEADLKSMLASVKIHNDADRADRNRDGGGLSVYLSELNQFLKDNGLSKKEFKPSDVLDNAAIMESLK